MTKFGWQGIALNVPASWELASYDGDEAKGTASLDDGVQMRLRVRWSPVSGRTPRMADTIARYKRSLAKTSKKRAVLETLDVEFLPPSFRRDKSALPFRWENGVVAHGVAWHCHICRRTLLLEVIAAPGADARGEAREILCSARCHRGDERRLWAVYGFAFLVPESYNLLKPELRPGRLTFPFQGPKGRWLRVERWGMAAQLLRKAPLERWPEELVTALPGGRPETCRSRSTEVSGNQARRFTALPLKQGLSRFLGRAPGLEGAVWHDAERDKMVAVIAGGEEAAVLEEVAASVQCE